MEQENIETSQPEQNLSAEQPTTENYDSGYEAESNVTDSGDAENVSHETYETEYTPESEIELLKRELQETRQKQYEFEQQMQQMYGNQQQPQEEREETYVDLVRDAINKISQEQLQVAAQQAQQRLDYDFQNNIRSVSQKIKDFDTVVHSVNCITPAMFDMVKAAENPGIMAYHAAKHHEPELRRISTLSSPQHQQRAMVQLEQKIMSSLKPRTVSTTPAPLSQTSGSAGITNDSHPKSIGDFARLLRQQPKRKR